MSERSRSSRTSVRDPGRRSTTRGSADRSPVRARRTTGSYRARTKGGTRSRSTLRPTLTRRQQLVAAGVVAALIALAAVVWFTPLLSVRDVEVRGLSAVPREQVIGALDVPTGTPLLRVDLTSAAARVATLPRVAAVTVDRHYPSQLIVSVTERVPVVFVDKPGGPRLLDASGVDFAAGPPPPGVPRLVTPAPTSSDPLTKAGLAVAGALPQSVRMLVAQVQPESPVDVRLTLADGRTVLWGAPVDLQHKGQVLAALLSQPGKTYDVSSPDLPTVS